MPKHGIKYHPSEDNYQYLCDEQNKLRKKGQKNFGMSRVIDILIRKIRCSKSQPE